MIGQNVASSAAQGLMPADMLKVRSVGEAKFSPDGNLVAYTVSNNDGPARPYSQLYVMDLRNGHTTRFSEGQESSGNPEWSPDGQWILARFAPIQTWAGTTVALINVTTGLEIPLAWTTGYGGLSLPAWRPTP